MQYFDSKIWVEPGSGAKIITNVAPTPNLLSSGVVAVIGESEGGLTMADGVVYQSDQPNFLKNILRSGVAYRCINFIFSPSVNTPGAQKVLFVRTQAATVGTRTITQSTGGSVTMTITSIDKGAYISDATNGLKIKLIESPDDATKSRLLVQLLGETIWTSPDVLTFKNLIDAIEADDYAKTVIVAAVTSGTSTTNIDDSVHDSNWVVLAGGTAPAMTSNDIDDALELIAPLTPNYIFIASEDATFHAKVLSFCNNISEVPVMAFFGGALGETVAQVKARALNLNDESSVLCYPDVIVPKEDGTGSETLSAMYLAAHIVGLRAGLPPYEPITWKRINVLGFSCHDGELTRTYREELIRAGVTYCRDVPGIGFAVNKGINTLQVNGSMIYKKVNGEATSPEISLIAIKNQIIRELIINSAPLFIGGTAATVTKEDILNFTKSYLNARTSSETEPNLLIRFEKVSAELTDDAWRVYFGFTPNTPINHVFFTGAMLRP